MYKKYQAQKRPKFALVVVIAAKIYSYHSTKMAKARPNREEWQADISVQKQWFMPYCNQGERILPTIACCRGNTSILPAITLLPEIFGAFRSLWCKMALGEADNDRSRT